jgi:hypothetical protein
MAAQDNDKRQEEQHEEHPFRYVGNMWGWKFSYVSLGIILFFIGFIALRHWMLDIPYDPSKIEMDPIVKEDSTANDTTQTQ